MCKNVNSMYKNVFLEMYKNVFCKFPNVPKCYPDVQKCEPNVFKMYIFAHKNKGVQKAAKNVF